MLERWAKFGCENATVGKNGLTRLVRNGTLLRVSMARYVYASTTQFDKFTLSHIPHSIFYDVHEFPHPWPRNHFGNNRTLCQACFNYHYAPPPGVKLVTGIFPPEGSWRCEICLFCLTRVLNPNASETSYKPKQRSYRITLVGGGGIFRRRIYLGPQNQHAGSAQKYFWYCWTERKTKDNF